MAPKNGEVIATKIAVIDIPKDHKDVPTWLFSARLSVKKALKMNVTINVVNGWFAKSYRDHEITSLLLNIFLSMWF